MKFKKKIINICTILLLVLLTNCVQATASLFGPAITVSQTGNIYHAGLSYVSNDIIKQQLGKTPIEYVTDIVIKDFSKNEPDIILAKKKQPDDKKILSNSVNNDYDYNEFLSAVKKVLK